MRMLNRYKETSRKLVSANKSTFYMHPSTPARVVVKVRMYIHCVHKEFPFTYCGCPIFMELKCIRYFFVVVEKVKAKCLS